jgi:hypothetical protein
MLLWTLNKITEFVCGKPAPRFGEELRECEDQSWFKVEAVPVFHFHWCKSFRVPQVEEPELGSVLVHQERHRTQDYTPKLI